MHQLNKYLFIAGSILLQEWRHMWRTALLQAVVVILLLTSGIALYYGQRVTGQHQHTIDSLQQHYEGQQIVLQKQLQRDTTTAQGKAAYISAAWPAVADHRLHCHVYNPPAPFSILSVGMSDISAYYYPVSVKSSYTPAEEKLSNPLQLISGNFDTAFLLIYLLPLLAICISYHLLAQDKEQGTLALLLVQKGGIAGIILVRLLARYLLLLTSIVFISTTGILLYTPLHHFPWLEWAAWNGVAAAWMALWMALIWFVIAWNTNAATNLVTLLSIWLLLLIVLPAGCRLMINRSHIDDTAGNASLQRNIGWTTWDLPKKQLLDSFYQTYPQYRNSRAYDTSDNSSRHAMAYYELVDRRMQRIITTQEVSRNKELKTVTSSLRYNPAVYTQLLLNSIARTDMSDYSYFQRQVQEFRYQWKQFFYQLHFNDRLLTVAGYKTLPAYHPAYDPESPTRWYNGILYLLMLTTAWIVAGWLVFRKRLQQDF
ncbi:DUF3526 domain-containing protein [Chitinophaga flava]|uniref:ABC transporter permease n=1 Tax=Chitinophaga flava TaxID=2259036 RepID=A0A365XRY9_9BACT|nr:DUF3526 domain-containing protein [Chitinophaga flava]RBL89126.1 hypothetical protein DF182_21570 [Chitinophaga flava]